MTFMNLYSMQPWAQGVDIGIAGSYIVVQFFCSRSDRVLLSRRLRVRIAPGAQRASH